MSDTQHLSPRAAEHARELLAFEGEPKVIGQWFASARSMARDYLDAAERVASLEEQLEAAQAESDRLREGVNDAAEILDVIGKWFTAGADMSDMGPILDHALPMMEKWEAKLSNPAKRPT